MDSATLILMSEVFEQITVHTKPVFEMDDDQFFQFCQINKELRLERNADGNILIMALEGLSSASGNAFLVGEFYSWAMHEGSGTILGSSVGFQLPNGAVRAPDVSWVRNERLDASSKTQWDKFLPFSPDFVVELRSSSDSLRTLQEKMIEYIRNGARLGWLLDPLTKQVTVYRPNRFETIENPPVLSGEALLPGFTLDVSALWKAMRAGG